MVFGFYSIYLNFHHTIRYTCINTQAICAGDGYQKQLIYYQLLFSLIKFYSIVSVIVQQVTLAYLVVDWLYLQVMLMLLSLHV
jgi:hypothetical protein